MSKRLFTQTMSMMQMHVDGLGYLDTIKDVKLPKIAKKTEDIEIGLGTLELDRGFEKLEGQFTSTACDPALYASFGLTHNETVSLSLKAAIDEDGEEKEYEEKWEGSFKSIESADANNNAMISDTYSVAIRRFGRFINGKEIVYIDIRNRIYRINGKDVTSNKRRMIGL